MGCRDWGDDRCVKLWDTNQNSSVMTIGIIAPAAMPVLLAIKKKFRFIKRHSASTGSKLKILDLNKRGSCISTLAGHTNEKVFAYHRSFSMPITSHKFSLADDDDGRFVSAVCSQKQSEMLVAANSVGSIKLLHMV
ncbi:hypothetical protein ACET3Z_010416 [Daucus carota]